MNFVREFEEDAAIGVGVAEQPDELDVFFAPGVGAAIWQRRLKDGFHKWIDALDPLQLPNCRLILKPEAVADAATEICQSVGMPHSTWRDCLIKDIAVLADLFAEMLQAEYLRIRLDVVSTDACRKFHIDAVTARLICTYRGTGTQYGISANGTDPAPIFTVATGSPILLRGTLCPNSPRSGLVHRSPPISGSGETRLVLVIDPMDGPYEEICLP